MTLPNRKMSRSTIQLTHFRNETDKATTNRGKKKKIPNRGELVSAEAGVDESLLPGDNAVPEAIVEPPVVLPIDESLGGEFPDLTAESRRELRGVEAIDRRDSADSGEELLVVSVDVVTKDGDQSHPGDHHALLRVLLALRRRDRGG